MIVGLAIQSVMCPFNLAENPLVSAVLLKGGLTNLKEKRVFNEKLREEMEDGDEITNEAGDLVSFTKSDAKNAKKNSKKPEAIEQKKGFEDVLLDTWDLGAEADIAPLMADVTKKNINHATKENGWTPVMIMSGLGAKSAGSALKQMKELGANPEAVDKEGWNALHWVSSMRFSIFFHLLCLFVCQFIPLKSCSTLIFHLIQSLTMKCAIENLSFSQRILTL